jgi:hypothetical protein
MVPMDFTFVHAADLHLDTPFQGIERVSDEVPQALRDASLEAFDGLIAATIERGAAFLLLAGDIYDGVGRGVRAAFPRRESGPSSSTETTIRWAGGPPFGRGRRRLRSSAPTGSRPWPWSGKARGSARCMA